MIRRWRGGWQVVERIGGTREGKRVRRWFRTLHEVAEALEGAQAQPAGTLGPALRALAVDFLRLHPPAAKDPRTYGSNTKLLLDRMGDLRLGEITPKTVEEFRRARIEQDHVQDFSTNRQVACLSAMFSCARDWSIWTGDNPCRKVKPFPEPDPRDRVFTGEEVARIFSAVEPDPMFSAMIATALYTALRKGALRLLRWTDLRDGFVIVPRENAKGRKRSIEVPIHPELQAILDRLPRQGPYVFHDEAGEPLTPDQIDGRWGRALTTARIVDPRGSRFHDLRRTALTVAEERGLGLRMIQRLAAHQQASTTERYLHMGRAAKRAAIPYLGPPKPPAPDPAPPSGGGVQGDPGAKRRTPLGHHDHEGPTG